MPTGNRPEFAELAIRCFARQDYPFRELVIVDDGSQRLAPELVNDSRIQYIRLLERQSTGAKRNLACRAARGDVIIQWDDDDWHGGGRIRKQIAPISRGVAEISGMADTPVLELAEMRLWAPSPQVFKRRALAGVHGGTLAYRREVFDHLTCYPDATHGEDIAFLRPALLAGCRVAAVPAESDFVYVRHGRNASRMAEFFARFEGRHLAAPPQLKADLPYYRQLQSALFGGPKLLESTDAAAIRRGSRSIAQQGTGLRRVDNLAVITTHFNPCGFRRPRENYQRFAAGIAAAGVPLWTAELAFDDDPFYLPAGDRTLHIRGSRRLHCLWQKERLLNLLIERLPANVDAIAWIDADVLLLNSYWAEVTRQTLASHLVAQLFSDGYDLKPDGQLERLRHSVGWAFAQGLPGKLDFSRSHPGFAWAARADLLREYGLYDCMVTGSGDALMLAGFAAEQLPMASQLNPAWEAHLRSWAQRVAGRTRGSLGYVPGSVLHLWHGSRTNRRYHQRLAALTSYRFDPATDLRLDQSGLWAWSETALRHKRAMVDFVRDYFALRSEDA
jgi:hypothetical protein